MAYQSYLTERSYDELFCYADKLGKLEINLGSLYLWRARRTAQLQGGLLREIRDGSNYGAY